MALSTPLARAQGTPKRAFLTRSNANRPTTTATAVTLYPTLCIKKMYTSIINDESNIKLSVRREKVSTKLDHARNLIKKGRPSSKDGGQTWAHTHKKRDTRPGVYRVLTTPGTRVISKGYTHAWEKLGQMTRERERSCWVGAQIYKPPPPRSIIWFFSSYSSRCVLDRVALWLPQWPRVPLLLATALDLAWLMFFHCCVLHALFFFFNHYQLFAVFRSPPFRYLLTLQL